MKATVTDISRRIEVKPSKTDGIYNYDIDNAYPQRVEDIINSSGTGTLCTQMMSKFIFGKGFKDESLSKTVINPKKKLTLNKLLKQTTQRISKYNGFAIHVNYNALYQKTSYSAIPFKDLRFTTEDDKEHPNMLALYDDWGGYKSSKVDKKKIEYFDLFNPDPKVIQEQVDKAGGWHNYKGQIFYWSVDGLEYPLCPADAVLEDLQTDSKAKTFKFRNISTNFLASHILETGEFESDDEREDFLEMLTNFQGSDDALQILLLEKATKESSFNLQKVDIQDIERLYEFTEESVRNNIIRQYLIPPILLLAIPGKLGSSSEIIEATAFYNSVTSEYRQSITEAFEILFANSVYNLDDKSFEIKELVPNTVETKDTIEGKKDIVNILSNDKLNDKQKKAVLTMIYKLSNEDADALIASEDMRVQ